MPVFSTVLGSALLVAALIPCASGHNIVSCVNRRPNATLWELELQDPQKVPWDFASNETSCAGYQRAAPLDTDYYKNTYNDQAYPWQGIWPVQDGTSIRTHRAMNWAQSNPDYSPGRPPTRVKPGSSILLHTVLNNHAHEFATRPSGHYKVYLAGPSGTQITTWNQFTDDRVIFKAPQNRFAHMTKRPGGPYEPNESWSDQNQAYLPLKMIDPTGIFLPEGTYNFVWTWWWVTDKTLNATMMPSYSSSFDVIIDSAAEDSGYLTDCMTTLGDAGCARHVTGNSTAPGAYDTRSPFPPYTDGYLTEGYEGNHNSDDNRSFQPYWTAFVPATKAPAIRLNVERPHVKGLGEDVLQAEVPFPPGSVWPNGTAIIEFPYGWAADFVPGMAEDSSGLKVTEVLNPMKVDGSQAGAVAPLNGTMASNYTMPTISSSGASTPTDASTTTPTTADTAPAAGGYDAGSIGSTKGTVIGLSGGAASQAKGNDAPVPAASSTDISATGKTPTAPKTGKTTCKQRRRARKARRD